MAEYTKINGALALVEDAVDENGQKYIKTTLLGTPKPETSKTIEDRLSALEADAEQAALDRAALALLLTGEETV